MKNYEIMFILSTQLTEEEKKANVELVEATLTKAGATEVKTEIWGDRKLAYPIQLKKNGFYTLIEFKGEGTVVADLELAFKRDERVIRYLTTKLDKHAVEYAVTRRSKIKAARA